MSLLRIVGLILVAIGITLLVFGYNASQSLSEQIVEGYTGRFTDRTMGYVIGGIAALVGGVALSLWGGRAAKIV